MRLLALCRVLALPVALALTVPSAMADTVSTNLFRSFDFTGSFALPIDAAFALDGPDDARRLANDRLGSWLGTDTMIQYTHSYGISLFDPGVSTPPDDNRLLFRALSEVVFEGGALSPSPQSSVLDVRWVCAPSFLQCGTGLVSTSRSSSIAGTAFATPAAVLQGFTLRSSA